MRFLSIILALAIAASAGGAGRMPEVKRAAAHSCCKHNDSSKHEKKKHDCGACPMACCRIATAPAEPISMTLALTDLATDVILPPMVVHALSEPTSIFHPPRAQ